MTTEQADATGWLRSTYCESSACFEVKRANAGVVIRNSTYPEGPVLPISMPSWRAFIAGVRAGDFDS
ncbi:DUF397 domain-containing protein [Catelliglobosispora koreensis]|uniref:DUF397 domain-containing protein n=1 Tax=Catelliglobosispora koreensis TaxID=129052 RepID=UPI000475874B